MSPVAPRKPVAAAAPQGVAFGSLAFYSGGFLLPEGRYCLYFNVVNHAFTKNDGSQGASRLGVMVDAYPLDNPTDVRQQFLSMGSKANLSFAPSPTGKGLVPIPGGPAATLSQMTGWQIFLKSLYDCGMPEGTLVDNFEAIDGVHVQTSNIPEPEERKGFGQATGEVEEQRKGPQLVPVVSEILDSGKPWEGTGGVPDVPLAAAPAPAARTAPKPPAAIARPGVKPAPMRVVAPPAPVEVAAEVDSDDVGAAAVSAITDVLVQPAHAAGIPKLTLRTSVFKAIKDPALKQAVLDTYFASDEALNTLLNPMGYTVAGPNVKPSA